MTMSGWKPTISLIHPSIQMENVDIALVKAELELCKKDLNSIKGQKSPHLAALPNELQGAEFREHHITKI